MIFKSNIDLKWIKENSPKLLSPKFLFFEENLKFWKEWVLLKQTEKVLWGHSNNTGGYQKWEKVRTTKITTSKTKKNSENSVDDQNIEKINLSNQNIEKRIITTSKRVDHYYKNHNVEKNVESHNLSKNHFWRSDHSQRHR